MMIKNYFKAAWRNIIKNKAFSFINITGLTIGLTSFLLIVLYVFDELTFDGFHKNSDNIYRIVEQRTFADGKTTKTTGAGFQVSERAKTDIPEIENAARLSVFGRANVISGDDKANVFYEDYIVANADFLKLFSFPLLYGERNNALTAPNSVILTEESAKKYFGTLNAIGKILFVNDESLPLTVTAVLKDFPSNSSIFFNLAVSESTILKNDITRNFVANDWSSGAFSTYFMLNNKTSIPDLNTKLDQLIAANRTADAGFQSYIQLQALKDVHFYSGDIDGFSGKRGNIMYIYVFIIIACFIIFIACINYMNLTTARFTNRGKEIAIRKVAGASRLSLAKQFLAEALLVTVFSFILSVGLVHVLLPAFNVFTEKSLSLILHNDYLIWTGLAVVIILVTVVAGLYPAVFQSRLNPLSLLKSRIHLNPGNISLRRVLVVFQFTISITLISATIIIYQQIQYVNNKDMGFDKEKLVVIDINSGKVRNGAATIKDEYAKLTQVRSVTVTSRVPGEWKVIPSVKVREGMNSTASEKDMYFLGVDDQFLSTYNIQLLKGRNFFSSGNADSASVLINETAAKALGITDAAGQIVTISSVSYGCDLNKFEKPVISTVAGIVKDFNFQSLHEPLAPMVLGFQNNPIQSIDYFTVKLGGGDVDATLKRLDGILHRIDQSHLFEYHFLDQQWELLYREDSIRQTIFFAMALLAIFIAALGLLGLTTYAAEQRVKEIGIRKVLGASVGGIVVMLSKDFLRLVLIASVIAFPVAWFSMSKWLEDFAYRININWWVFILSAAAAVAIALVTISFQAIKAALANPVKSLRTE
ncbi:MAG: ABC transporter permease [Chitinophagaceae bacterium]|nr:ABC transporter permease [Chitinophagaceae bacterium]MCW5926715.1 ABC transporter permease [Chitinophagaceae bacterium]